MKKRLLEYKKLDSTLNVFHDTSEFEEKFILWSNHLLFDELISFIHSKEFEKIAIKENKLQIYDFFKYFCSLQTTKSIIGVIEIEDVDGKYYGQTKQIVKVAAEKGYGPLMYDLALSKDNLTPSRFHVSDKAKKVWSYYYYNRKDVEKTQMEPQSEFEEEDIDKNPELYQIYHLKNKLFDIFKLEKDSTKVLQNMVLDVFDLLQDKLPDVTLQLDLGKTTQMIKDHYCGKLLHKYFQENFVVDET